MMNLGANSDGGHRLVGFTHLGAWLGVQILLAAGLAWLNRGVLNHDAIAYLRIGEYYAAGDSDHMISGYWGPLLSWLIAGGLMMGMTAELSARVSMLVSAAVFLLAGNSLFSSFALAGLGRKLGLMLCAVTAATWSAQNITPDLLMSGLAIWALAAWPGPAMNSGISIHLVRDRWCRPAFAGLLWGLAYLAKPVALPWCVLLLVAAFVTNWWRGRPDWLRMSVFILALLVFAGPWVTVLSLKEGRFTISTSGPTAHALAGPADVDRYHPAFITLHQPEPGRISAWEGPTKLTYQPWSPFASRAYLRHQFLVVATNVLKVLFILTTLVPIWPWVIWRWLRAPRSNPAVGFALLPLGLLALIYLPVYLSANEQRYFYVAVPLLWCALAGLPRVNAASEPANLAASGGSRLASSGEPLTGRRSLLVPAAVILVFAAASLVRFSYPPRVASRDARELAGWLVEQGKRGPVAGSALQRGGRTGLFLAWHLREAWLGDDPAADAATLANCGARFIVLRRDDPRLDALVRISGLSLLEPASTIAPGVAIVEVSDQAD